jgi:hypothetical protein
MAVEFNPDSVVVHTYELPITLKIANILHRSMDNYTFYTFFEETFDLIANDGVCHDVVEERLFELIHDVESIHGVDAVGKIINMVDTISNFIVFDTHVCEPNEYKNYYIVYKYRCEYMTNECMIQCVVLKNENNI